MKKTDRLQVYLEISYITFAWIWVFLNVKSRGYAGVCREYGQIWGGYGGRWEGLGEEWNFEQKCIIQIMPSIFFFFCLHKQMSVCLFCLHKQENKNVFNRITLLLYIKSEEACVLNGDTGYSTQQIIWTSNNVIWTSY